MCTCRRDYVCADCEDRIEAEQAVRDFGRNDDWQIGQDRYEAQLNRQIGE